ncbi:hypothetical protein OE88DRAFT_1669481 [Heliocybe sulcata]|uniref:BZIP domain-containing protein n=1 Tax=Heliocybe sulcata TaxID=5364 RepID=A0A5C3MLV5_9AGAM|nr:hypothetical protein OE88DRAFT_1669481 [Heliocybe sulcata]
MANCKYKDDGERKEAKNRQNQAWYRRKRAKLLERAVVASVSSRSSGSRSLSPGARHSDGEDVPSPEDHAHLISTLDERLRSVRARCAATGYDSPVHTFLLTFEASYTALFESCCLTKSAVFDWLARYQDMLREGNAILDDLQAVVTDCRAPRYLADKWAEMMEISMKVHWLMAVVQVRLDLIQRHGTGGEVDWAACVPR